MLPKKQWNKITKALDAGKLKLRFLTDQEYAEIETNHKKAKEAKTENVLIGSAGNTTSKGK